MDPMCLRTAGRPAWLELCEGGRLGGDEVGKVMERREQIDPLPTAFDGVAPPPGLGRLLLMTLWKERQPLSALPPQATSVSLARLQN